MKVFSIFLLAVFFGYTAKAQQAPEINDDWQQAIYVELFGNSIVAAINYDLRLSKNRTDGHGVRVGIGGFPVKGKDAQGTQVNGAVFTIPLAYNYLIGKRRSALELGAGVTPMFGRVEVVEIGGDEVEESGFAVAGFLNAGYRYRPLNKGLVFRFTWTPALTSEGFYPVWFGLSLGYGYK